MGKSRIIFSGKIFGQKISQTESEKRIYPLKRILSKIHAGEIDKDPAGKLSTIKLCVRDFNVSEKNIKTAFFLRF